MTVRYCIYQQPNQRWSIIDHQAGPGGDKCETMRSDFMVLLDAIHYMFSHGHGEFFIKKS